MQGIENYLKVPEEFNNEVVSDGPGKHLTIERVAYRDRFPEPDVYGYCAVAPGIRTTVGAAPTSLTDMNTPCTLQL